MIWNLLNMLLGIWLVRIAVLNPAFVALRSWHLPAFGVAIVVLAVLARPRDFLKWTSAANIALGIVLLVLVVLQWNALAPDMLTFWVVFWVGMVVAILALWSVLYRPGADAESAEAGGPR